MPQPLFGVATSCGAYSKSRLAARKRKDLGVCLPFFFFNGFAPCHWPTSVFSPSAFYRKFFTLDTDKVDGGSPLLDPSGHGSSFSTRLRNTVHLPSLFFYSSRERRNRRVHRACAASLWEAKLSAVKDASAIGFTRVKPVSKECRLEVLLFKCVFS